MINRSTILIPDAHNEGEALIIIGTPEGNRVLRGATGEVLFDSSQGGSGPISEGTLGKIVGLSYETEVE